MRVLEGEFLIVLTIKGATQNYHFSHELGDRQMDTQTYGQMLSNALSPYFAMLCGGH